MWHTYCIMHVEPSQCASHHLTSLILIAVAVDWLLVWPLAAAGPLCASDSAWAGLGPAAVTVTPSPTRKGHWLLPGNRTPGKGRAIGCGDRARPGLAGGGGSSPEGGICSMLNSNPCSDYSVRMLGKNISFKISTKA